MSVGLYDKAFVALLEAWLPEDHKIRILKPDETSELFKIKADENNDRPIVLPIIALSREPHIHISNTFKQPKSFDGVVLTKLDKHNKEVKGSTVFKLNAIPMQIDYQLDIYTKQQEQADNYLREFVFKFVNNPKLVIEIPYNGIKYKHESTIYMNNDIEDNSDIPLHKYKGQFTRYTIKLRR